VPPRGPKAATGLAARIHLPGTAPPARSAIAATTATAAGGAQHKPVTRSAAAARRAQQVQVGLQRNGGAVKVPPAVPAAPSPGFSIRGLAGPFVVMAQNFAPGTTAADIESAVTPVGGLVSSCRLVKTHPLIIAEIVFESREGAERVIETFNNQTVSLRSPL
jgi:hypothetical protein